MTTASENVGQWGKVSRAAFESFRELASINTKLVERLSEQQLELVGASLDAGIRGAEIAVAAPSYREFTSAQAALFGEYQDRVLGVLRKANGVLNDVRDEYSTWTEGRLKDIGAPVTRAAKKSA